MVQRGREEIGPRPGKKVDDAAFHCPMRVRQKKCALGLIKVAAPSGVTTVATAQSAEFLIDGSSGPFLNCRTCSSSHAR